MTMDRATPGADDVDVTDTSDTSSRATRAVAVAAATVLAAASLAVVVGVDDPAAADTVVTSAVDAVVALPDGTTRTAVEGDRLPSGAQLRTGKGGAARLTTDGRDVLLGALSTVRVVDGVREVLERGQVMVDARTGPRLSLQTQGGTVSTAAGALARVERAALLRVAVYQGRASLSVAGRQATTAVPALHQVLAQYGGLPATPTVLALTPGDPWEVRYVNALVEADADLRGKQEGLRGAEGAVVLAATRRDLVDASASCPAATTDRGERALSLAVAEAADAAGSPTDRLATVCSGRAEGGSWGVVAALVRASVSDVSARLDDVLEVDTAAVAAVAGTQPQDPVDLVFPTAAPSPGGPSSSPRPGPTDRPTDDGSPTPEPPAPSPGLVDTVVGIVTGLLPTPAPAAPAPPVAVVPSPSATPLLQLGGLKVG